MRLSKSGYFKTFLVLTSIILVFQPIRFLKTNDLRSGIALLIFALFAPCFVVCINFFVNRKKWSPFTYPQWNDPLMAEKDRTYIYSSVQLLGIWSLLAGIFICLNHFIFDSSNLVSAGFFIFSGIGWLLSLRICAFIDAYEPSKKEKAVNENQPPKDDFEVF